MQNCDSSVSSYCCLKVDIQWIPSDSIFISGNVCLRIYLENCSSVRQGADSVLGSFRDSNCDQTWKIVLYCFMLYGACVVRESLNWYHFRSIWMCDLLILHVHWTKELTMSYSSWIHCFLRSIVEIRYWCWGWSKYSFIDDFHTFTPQVQITKHSVVLKGYTMTTDYTMGMIMETVTQSLLVNATNLPHGPIVNPQDWWQVKMHQAMMLYIAPIIMIFGTLGNIISFCVLHTPFFRKTTCGFLLCALAIADTGSLNTVLMRLWLQEIPALNRLDIRKLSVVGCKIHTFLSYLFPQLSSWTLSLVTIDRAVCVTFPLRSRIIWRKKRLVITWFLMFLFLFVLNIHLLVFQTISVETLGSTGILFKHCTPDREHREFVKRVWVWIDFVLVDCIPCIVIVVCNILIIASLVRSHQQRERATNITPGNSRDRQLHTTSMMLVCISIAFLIFVTPRCAYFFISRNHTYSHAANTLKDVANFQLFYTSVILIYSLSNAGNFALYCFSGSRFRFSAYMLLSCRKLPSDNGSMNGSATNLRSVIQWKIFTEIYLNHSNHTDWLLPGYWAIVTSNNQVIFAYSILCAFISYTFISFHVGHAVPRPHFTNRSKSLFKVSSFSSYIDNLRLADKWPNISHCIQNPYNYAPG